MAIYTVWCPELSLDEADGKKIAASDAAEAATIWAQREDSESSDYWIVGGDGTTVIVRDEYGREETIRVWGERRIEYYADAVR